MEHIPHSILTLPCIHDTTTASVPDHHHKVQPIIHGSYMEGIRHAVQAKQFRQSRANDHTLRWDVVDEMIATDVLRTFIQLGNTATTPSSLVTCYRCRRKGHIAAQCIANMGDNQGSTVRNNYNSIDNTYSHVRNNMVPRLGSNNYRNRIMPLLFPPAGGGGGGGGQANRMPHVQCHG